MSVDATQPRQIFVSYARKDDIIVEDVVHGLEELGDETWVDRSLQAGQEWWDEILRQIRDCDVFLQVVSRAALDSVACAREREYARDLGKPLLPVRIERMQASLLPSDLAHIQYVDFTDVSSEQAFKLAGALSRCPRAPALPDPLPAAPEAPISYLVELSELAHAAALSQDQQWALVARLRSALGEGSERDGAIALLRVVRGRADLLNAVANDIDAALEAEPANVGQVRSRAQGRNAHSVSARTARPTTTDRGSRRRSGKAAASLIVGVIAMLFYWAWILGPIAIVLGRRARQEIAASPDLQGRKLANWGIALGSISIIAWSVLLLVFALQSA